MIKSGDRVPSVPVRLVTASGVTETDTAAVLGKGRVVLFAVPGAFTPTCDTSHLPGFVANAPKMKAQGVTRIVCAAANDHHVLKAWAESKRQILIQAEGSCAHVWLQGTKSVLQLCVTSHAVFCAMCKLSKCELHGD